MILDGRRCSGSLIGQALGDALGFVAQGKASRGLPKVRKGNVEGRTRRPVPDG
jgi:hypothetical protein